MIEIAGLSKRYRLGSIGLSSLRDELERAWTRWRGRTPAKSAADFWALRDVSFEVHPSEVVGLLGHNGAGKSTLLKILSRLTEPSAGEITLRGRVGSLLEVGTGFQPELSGRDNIFLNGSILGMRKTEIVRKFDEIVAFAGVEQFIDTPVKRYSSGMYVRLAFAVAAHLEPEVLIIDEVLAVGDAEFQRKCIDKIDAIRRTEGRTILFVSHNIDIVSRLCTRCVLLEHGAVKSIGPTPEMVREYRGVAARTLAAGRWLDLDGLSRKGSGAVRFTRTRFEALNPACEGRVTPDAALRFDVELHARQPAVARSLAVTVYSPSGTKLLNYDTLNLNELVRFHAGTNTFSLATDPLPLNPGTYTVGLWLELSAAEGAADWIETAYQIEVEPTRAVPGWLAPYSDGPILSRFQLSEGALA
jgi:lipopolysaccharide transport system ATP-binding protein